MADSPPTTPSATTPRGYQDVVKPALYNVVSSFRYVVELSSCSDIPTSLAGQRHSLHTFRGALHYTQSFSCATCCCYARSYLRYLRRPGWNVQSYIAWLRLRRRVGRVLQHRYCMYLPCLCRWQGLTGNHHSHSTTAAAPTLLSPCPTPLQAPNKPCSYLLPATLFLLNNSSSRSTLTGSSLVLPSCRGTTRLW